MRSGAESGAITNKIMDYNEYSTTYTLPAKSPSGVGAPQTFYDSMQNALFLLVFFQDANNPAFIQKGYYNGLVNKEATNINLSLGNTGVSKSVRAMTWAQMVNLTKQALGYANLNSNVFRNLPQAFSLEILQGVGYEVNNANPLQFMMQVENMSPAPATLFVNYIIVYTKNIDINLEEHIVSIVNS